MPFAFPTKPYDMYEKTHGRGKHYRTSGIPNRVRNSDPETSKAAAESFDPSPVEVIIMETLLEIGPAITHEISDACGIGFWTVTPRMSPMAEKNIVYDTGMTKADVGNVAMRRKGTNRESIIWDVCRPVKKYETNGTEPAAPAAAQSTPDPKDSA
jgi:hypothetical protein